MNANTPTSNAAPDTGSSRKGFFLAFLGGALLGGAAVFAADAKNRELVMSYIEKSRRIAGLMPDAIVEARDIARDNAKATVQEVGDLAKEVFEGASNRH